MAPVVPVGEPSVLTAGSTATWTVSSATFPVSEGWALSYALAGASTLAWSSGYVTDDGSTHTVSLPVAATSPLSAGRYELSRIWTGSGDYAGERHVEGVGVVQVVADPATLSAGDAVAFAERNLAYVEAAITARLKGDQPEKYEIGGRAVERMTLVDLTAMRHKLQGELWKLKNPGVGNRSLAVRFSVPTA